MADAEVRAAQPRDAEEIARIQLLTWRTAYGDILPIDVLAALDEYDVARQWRGTIERGPARVFVATEGDWVVGFGAAGPAPAGEAADATGRPETSWFLVRFVNHCATTGTPILTFLIFSKAKINE